MILTTSYEGPDLDGYSSAVAYAEFLRAEGKDATAAIWGEPQLEVRWLIEEFGFARMGPMSPIDLTQVVLLDASDLDGLPSVFSPDQVVEIISSRGDH